MTRQSPPPGWATIWALCAVAGVQPRTLRQWIEDELVERPHVHGYNTFYSPRAVLQVRAIAHLRASGERLGEIAPKVKGASDAALNALLPAPTTPPEVGVAPAAPTSPDVPADDAAIAGERWVVVPLMAGLKLVVRDDATAFVRRAAAEIAQRYGVK